MMPGMYELSPHSLIAPSGTQPSDDGLPSRGPGTPSSNGQARSLEGLHSTVPVPPANGSFWQHYRAFIGPAFLVSVGYMDPGNWATDLKAGADYRYGLLWVVALSSVMAIFMQIIAA